MACEVFQADRVCSYDFHTRRQRVPVTPEWCTFQDLRSHKISSGNGFNLAAPRLDPANEVAREPQMAQYVANVYDRCVQFQIHAPTWAPCQHTLHTASGHAEHHYFSGRMRIIRKGFGCQSRQDTIPAGKQSSSYG